MENKVQKRTVTALAVTGNYQNDWCNKVGTGRHLHGLGNNEIPRRIMESKLEGSRKMRIPKLRWLDDVMEDLRKLGIRRWWIVAREEGSTGSRRSL
jgi:hypothetical protein